MIWLCYVYCSFSWQFTLYMLQAQQTKPQMPWYFMLFLFLYISCFVTFSLLPNFSCITIMLLQAFMILYNMLRKGKTVYVRGKTVPIYYSSLRNKQVDIIFLIFKIIWWGSKPKFFFFKKLYYSPKIKLIIFIEEILLKPAFVNSDHPQIPVVYRILFLVSLSNYSNNPIRDGLSKAWLFKDGEEVLESSWNMCSFKNS